MNFNKHYQLEGQHAFLSASTYHWIRYDELKLKNRWRTAQEARRGVELHEYAATAIRLKRKQPHNKDTVNQYINDAIGFRMSPEVVLYYSPNCFGTADAIGFRNNKLRIFDLKNGVSKVSIDQLLVYAALFCLEYGVSPFEIEFDLRIYQSNDIQFYTIDPGDIRQIMDIIIRSDDIINNLKVEGGA